MGNEEPEIDPWSNREALRYPDPALEVIDPRFAELTAWNAAVERLWTGGRWTEGPVWFGDGRCLLFSDIPNNVIMRWDEETGRVHRFRAPADHANGNTRDRQGRLITCEHLTRRVSRTEYDGSVTVLLDGYQGKRLNAPNDVAVHSDGSIWFTDPGYGIDGDYEGDRAEHELPQYVYRVDPDSGDAEPVISTVERPNGVCFSPDETRVYVVGATTIEVFELTDRTPRGQHTFVDLHPGNSDGIRTDRAGNLWAAAFNQPPGGNGVHCYAPDGTLLGRIRLPEVASNLCFGGRKKNRLFITASRSLYSVYLETIGA